MIIDNEKKTTPVRPTFGLRLKQKGNRTPKFSVISGAVLGLCLLLNGALASDIPAPANKYQLTENIEARVGADGSLELVSPLGPILLLQGEIDALADTRRRRGKSSEPSSFVGLAREGQTGGHRGFSSHANDDSDTQTDEDPLDGLDNDGDGAIDEDFAAISDAMTAIHLSEGSGQAQLEFMHWAGPRLSGLMMMNLSATHQLSGATIPYYRLSSKDRSWREVEVSSRRHDISGRNKIRAASAFVTLVPSVKTVGHSNQSAPSSLISTNQESEIWVGVVLLDQAPDLMATAQFRPQLDRDVLSLPLQGSPLPVAVCTASSWLQLNRLLIDAISVYEGVTDPVNHHQAHWIVSPLCSTCRLEKDLKFSLLQIDEDQLDLSFELEAGRSCLMDPDLFSIQGMPLGAPHTVIWEPVDGARKSISWDLVTLENLTSRQGNATDLYGNLGNVESHSAQGKLHFQFSNPAKGRNIILAENSGIELNGSWLDGRIFSSTGVFFESKLDDENSDVAAISQEILVNDKKRLTLAPRLLEGWPNPFQDQIQIKFTVPSSVQQAFAQDEKNPLPEGVDPAAPVRWKSGQPTVSVKVYSINGQELVSLHQGTLAEGQYTVSWNGTDVLGRKVASGTYFCKLQLDTWSVTRRLVYLR